MTHGNRVEPEVGQAIAEGLRDQRVILPDRMPAYFCVGPNGRMDSRRTAAGTVV
jgi:hypothetical protein